MWMFYVDDGLAAARSDEEAEALVDLVASISGDSGSQRMC